MDKWKMDSTKLQYHPERIADFLSGKKIAPIIIDAGIHKSCNISCAFCYGVKQKKSNKYIPTPRLLKLADDMKEVGVKAIAIIGDGEPTMNKGLYDFVERLKILDIKAAVATNGLLLDKRNIERLTASLVWLRFNISGVAKYESIMGAPKNSFKRFEDIVKYAVEKKGDCTIGLQSVLIPEGFSDIVPLAQKAVEWGVDYLVVKQFSDGGEGMPLHFDMDEYANAQVRLKEAEALSNDKTQIIIKWKAMCDSTNITKHKKYEFDRCRDLPFLFQMSGDGGCYPCGYLFGNKEYCYGNIIDQDLKDILKSDRYWAIIKKVAETPLDKLCAGQCRHTQTNKFIHELVNPVNHIDFI